MFLFKNVRTEITEVELSDTLKQIMMQALLIDAGSPATLCFRYWTHALQMTQCGLELISCGMWLFDEPYTGRERWCCYGFVVSLQTQGNITTDVDQSQLRHKKFPSPSMGILKTHLRKFANQVLLFSSDLTLDAETLMDYYSLRFQLELKFRDSKHWGLEDFMNVNKTPVNNAANVSMFMVNVSATLALSVRTSRGEHLRSQSTLSRTQVFARNIKNTSAKTYYCY